MKSTRQVESSVPFRNLGRALLLLRETRGLSNKELAQRSGIGMSQLSGYERGHTLPQLETLERLLKELRVTPVDFFTTIAFLDGLDREMEGVTDREAPAFGTLGETGILEGELSSILKRMAGDLLALQEKVLKVTIRRHVRDNG